MKATDEHERKLDAPEGFELPELGGEPLEARVFTSIYHDSPDGSLTRAGITLRRRVEHGRSLWQLKLPAPGEARLELEELGGPDGPPPKLTRLLTAHLRRGGVVPIAELRTRRHGTLVTRNGSSAEVTIDEVAVMDALRVVESFVEVEIELRTGHPRDLDAIAKQVERAGARAGSGRPKVFRALGVSGERPKPKEPFAALRELLRVQHDAILAHDPGTRLGRDPESLHDMRVAVRRLRALLRTSRPLYTTDVDTLERELKWLGELLGAVRDTDVLLARLRGDAAQLDPADEQAAGRLLRTLETQRSRARRTLLKALGAERYLRLLDRMEDTVESLAPTDADVSLEQLAQAQLKKVRRSVKKLGGKPSDEELHALRKRGKRLRYAFELAGDGKVVKRAKALQDVLGEHQDSVVAESRLRALAAAGEAEDAVAAGLLVAVERRRRAEARAAWPAAWRKLRRATG